MRGSALVPHSWRPLTFKPSVVRFEKIHQSRVSAMSQELFRTGILVLTSPLSVLSIRTSALLASITKQISGTLYVHLHPGLDLAGPNGAPRPMDAVLPTWEMSQLIIKLYEKASDICNHIDIRVLLSHICSPQIKTKACNQTRSLSFTPDVILTDHELQDQQELSIVEKSLRYYITKYYSCPSGHPSYVPLTLDAGASPPSRVEANVTNTEQTLAAYNDVVLGGTFDRLHNGHKSLLATACLLARKRLLIGIADKDLLKGKRLFELIQPFGQRCLELKEFLCDVNPNLQYDIVPITDVCGPSITDEHLNCIVVSEETRKGGEIINAKRKERGLSELAVHTISLMADHRHALHEEAKVSSSSLRARLLGTLMKTPSPNPKLPRRPYIIGMTGGSASGKSSIAKRLELLGATHINCDRLGHLAYRPGTRANAQIVQTFDVLNEDGSIDRKCLAEKVFANKEEMQRLTDIVWPVIREMTKHEISEHAKKGQDVCILDAAVLLEAGWSDMAHEVWVSIITEHEALRRIQNRDGLSQEKARNRLASQWTNSQRVQQANVVLCTEWDPEVTQQQVEKAWNLLRRRMDQ
uniref:bifunctional coenzyme A synthase isoform X2 n=1 Tax=Myxine glutinosa TaxID=7769 RepID=UPI00358F2061